MIGFPVQLYCSFPTKLTQTVKDPGGSPQKRIALAAMTKEKGSQISSQVLIDNHKSSFPRKGGLEAGLPANLAFDTCSSSPSPIDIKIQPSRHIYASHPPGGKKRKKKDKKEEKNQGNKIRRKKREKGGLPRCCTAQKRKNRDGKESTPLWDPIENYFLVRPITDCLPPVRRRSLRKARILVCRHFQLLDPFPFLSFIFSVHALSPSSPLLLFPFLASSPLLAFFFFFWSGPRPAKQINQKNSGKTRQSTDMPHPKL